MCFIGLNLSYRFILNLKIETMTLKKHFYWLCSFLIDFLIVFLFVMVLKRLMAYVGGISFETLYIIVFGLYALIIAFSKGKSVGRQWMRIQLQSGEIYPSKSKIFIREFFLQWGIFFIIPLYVIKCFNLPFLSYHLIAVFIVVNTLIWAIVKTNFVDLISKTQIITKLKNNSKPKINFRLFLAFILDVAIAFSLTLLTEMLLLQWVFIKTIYLFLIVYCIYYMISYLLLSQTFGKYFFGISIISKVDNNLSLMSFIKREVIFKLGLCYVLPIAILISLGWVDIYMLVCYMTIFNSVFMIIYYSINKELWWNSLSSTKYSLSNLSIKFSPLKYLIILAFFGITYSIILINNNTNNPAEHKVLGFNYPIKKAEYPNNSQIKPYSDFLSNNKLQTPKEYILSLFEENDIVILCESDHNEDTQWDFIYDVVSDTSFINNVGTIFTEYGYTGKQNEVDDFLNTNFSDDTLMMKQASTLMNYKAGNFYNFMTKLNKLNNTTVDSSNISLHFTDVNIWQYLNSDWPSNVHSRDSLMASVIINWHKKAKKKCLVITNSRHAFAINKSAIKKHPEVYKTHLGKNEGQYIYDYCPDKTANVMLYGNPSINYIEMIKPIQNGKWRTAFLNNNTPIGFDLANTPFGEEDFDLRAPRTRYSNIKFQDIFTGFVFLNTKEQHVYINRKVYHYINPKVYQFS